MKAVVCNHATFTKENPTSFFKYVFKHTRYNTLVRLYISLARIQPATRAMLQKDLIMQNAKLLLKMTVSNLKKTWTNMALFEFGLGKFDIRKLPWSKVKFKDYFLTVFRFTLVLFKAVSQDGQIINLDNIRVIFTLYFL